MGLLTTIIGDDHELRWREGFEIAAKLLVNVNRCISHLIETGRVVGQNNESEEKQLPPF